MKIRVEAASKRFQYEWIFKNLSIQLESGDSLAITGSNGSGKSTLLKCLTGSIPLTSGKIEFSIEGKGIEESDWFKHLSIAAPYLELPEEFTLSELLDFHFKFKKPIKGISIQEILELVYLKEHHGKFVSQFSSGMKQRLKLALALLSKSDVIFLDEPTSNLDKKGIAWYQKLVESYQLNRILIVCSNEQREYDFCQQKLALEDYK
ncbi:MAG: ATP-binding cassette domain-containing protein [Algoriphagus sp.]|uniref:ABC transporter ATP-binding protein n=1 Tax=Algoriphagus sp. TaxID=1872435 RepID=UPI0017A31341|nr:ATP-binding cassette domain-containing protein [Algoriphagus sp.]NVJ87349.1 ATP-binding cassette domain-containing protein [Algoriphagus sp.]